MKIKCYKCVCFYKQPQPTPSHYTFHCIFNPHKNNFIGLEHNPSRCLGDSYKSKAEDVEIDENDCPKNINEEELAKSQGFVICNYCSFFKGESYSPNYTEWSCAFAGSDHKNFLESTNYQEISFVKRKIEDCPKVDESIDKESPIIIDKMYHSSNPNIAISLMHDIQEIYKTFETKDYLNMSKFINIKERKKVNSKIIKLWRCFFEPNNNRKNRLDNLQTLKNYLTLKLQDLDSQIHSQICQEMEYVKCKISKIKTHLYELEKQRNHIQNNPAFEDIKNNMQKAKKNFIDYQDFIHELRKLYIETKTCLNDALNKINDGINTKATLLFNLEKSIEYLSESEKLLDKARELSETQAQFKEGINLLENIEEEIQNNLICINGKIKRLIA